MRRALVCILTISLSLFFPPLSSGATDDRSSKNILDNGLTVLITEMPSSPVVSVYALVKTGSATEGKYLGTGISHFLEHMLFKGTHDREVGELAARIQAVGGEVNASTSMDYTMYTITVPYESFDVALDILSDMLMHATMESEEVERERKVIFGEMRLHQDNPDRKIGELTFKNVYIRHPYRHPVIGYEALLAEVTREDLIEYYRDFYTPNNTILSVAGHIDGQEVLSKIKKTFKDFKRSRAITRNLPQEPPQISPRRYEMEYPTDLTRLSMSFNGVSLLDPDLYALDVLSGILGQGRSSRLYLDVYQKKGLVYSIAASNYTPVDRGIFGIDCLLEQKNVAGVIKAVLKQINLIKKKGVKPEELAKEKLRMRSEHVFHRQTASSVTYAQAIDEAFSGDYQFSRKYVEAVSHVTNDDIQRVAKKYLNNAALTTVILKPEEEKKGRPVKEEVIEQTAIQKHVLKNGLTVLLKEDHTFPLISLRVSVNGGVRQEYEPLALPAKLNGLSKMMALTWIKGTKRYSANQIAEKTESLGMRLGSFSGRNSFGLSLEFLTEYLPAAFDLLKEIVIYPVFPEEEIIKMKKNMKAAIRRRDDNIFQATAHVLKETLFLTNPFRLEQGGTVESVDRIAREDLVNFYGRHAVPGNMVLSVFGDMKSEEVLRDIKRMFGGLKDKEVILNAHKEDPPLEPRENVFEMDKEQAMVMFGFHGAKFGDDDYYGLEVLTSILGASFSGRLFTNIRDQLGEAYTLGGSFIPGPDTGFIYFYVLTTAEETDKVQKLLKGEITTLQSDLVPAQELKDIQTYLKGTFKASQETGSSLSFTVSLDEIYGLGYQNYKQYDQRIDAVTQDELRRLARQYLDLNKVAIVVTTPKNSGGN